MKTTRRSFLKSSALAASALALPASSWAAVRGANEDIRVAVIGFNGRGKDHIEGFRKVPGVRLVALCDVDKNGARPRAVAPLGPTREPLVRARGEFTQQTARAARARDPLAAIDALALNPLVVNRTLAEEIGSSLFHAHELSKSGYR